MSLFSFSTARLITWKCTSMSRTFSASSTHREVTQANGQAGSNQKSTLSLVRRRAGRCRVAGAGAGRSLNIDV